MRPRATPFTIRRRLAGLTLEDVGQLLDITRERVWQLGKQYAACHDLSELRSDLRVALNKGPDHRVVYQELKRGWVVKGCVGRNVRWTRIILDITLLEWAADFGHSGTWWSKFERDEDRAWRAVALGSISYLTTLRIGPKLNEAAHRLAELFPSATLPRLQGHDPTASRGRVLKVVADTETRELHIEGDIVHPHGRRIAGRAE